MKRNKTKQNLSKSLRWYETCGEAFFTQVLPPFFDYPSRELKTLSLTCHFIYEIYSSKSGIDVWHKLILQKYPELNAKLLENANGKLMMLFYQLIYYENHLDQLPEKLLTCRVSNQQNSNDPRPRFMCASSRGYYYAQGFITMLISSFFDEEYDPCVMDDFRYYLEMDDNSRKLISLFPISLYEEYPALIRNYIDSSDGMIFILVIRDDFHSNAFESLFSDFNVFYKQLENAERLNQFIVTICIDYKDQVDDSFKKIVGEELRNYLSHNYIFNNSLIVECSPNKRDQVLKTTIESVKKYRFINVELFLNYLFHSDKKKCSIM